MTNRLKEVREKKGLTVLQLSQKSGVSRQTIYNLEADPAAIVTSEVMEQLAKALGIKATKIFLF